MKLSQNVYSVFSFYLLFMSIMGYMLGLYFMYENICFFFEWEIVLIKSSSVVMSIIFDWMSLMFMSSVFLIAGSICKFSDYYMMGDKDYLRFMYLLISFVTSMIFLIISPNIISILLGWDGLGLTSYALVIYYQNESSCNAGMLTVLSNRIGDVCILMSIGLLFFNGSWNFLFFDSVDSTLIVCVFILMAAMTKSAQIPFSAWLPAAMAAPTPVSALVHSSTLVTAGVFLLIRFYPCIENKGVLWILLLVSSMTSIMSGWSANFEVDMKKIIALSTLSQLGLMMMILSMGMPELAFFHLLTHAMFKSTLFMCGGSIIHMSNGSQDCRMMSSLSLSSPLLMSVFMLTNLALSGFPFLAGFYSKDLLLEFFFSGVFNNMLVFLMVVATGLTVSYSLRSMFLGMSMINNLKSVSDLMDMDKKLKYSMSILILFSMFLGFFFSWNFCWNSMSMVLGNFSKYYIICSSLISGLLISYFCMNFSNFKMIIKSSISFYGYSRMWFMPFISTKYLINIVMMLSEMGMKVYDKGWFEKYGGKGGESLFTSMSMLIHKSQKTILLKNYFINMLMILFFIFMFY